MSTQDQHLAHRSQRLRLDQLFLADSVLSITFGVISLVVPHVFMAKLAGVAYNHEVHEAIRLYSCLRLAMGWILWHIRKIDDGFFRRHMCEALLVCYSLQALVVLRAQFTDRQLTINWIAILILTLLAALYGSFRFGKGGNLIKLYELPTASVLH